jgi:chromosome partitioning protein
MATIITVAQQKGGAGKTTLAANLAAAIAADGRRVAVVDIDPQASLSRWHALRMARKNPATPIHLASIAGWRLAGELERLHRSHQVLIIDSPPSVDTDARLAVRSASLVLVPMQPSPPDLWAAEGTLKLAATEKRAFRILLNRAPAAGRLRAAVQAEIERQSLPAFAATLGNRTGFATAFAQGLGVSETAPNSLAARELAALLAEIEETLA